MNRNAALIGIAALFLIGCTNTINFSQRDIDKQPLPMISSLWGASYGTERRVIYITAIDDNPIGKADIVHVEAGVHKITYSDFCRAIDASSRIEESITLNIKAGMMYYLDSSRETETEMRQATNVVGWQRTRDRDAQGRLIETVEPVYSTTRKPVTTVNKCSVNVLECRGYLYGNRSGPRCMSEELSFIQRSKGDWTKLF